MLADICSLLPVVCYNAYEAKLFKAVYLLAYFGLFRVSELVCTSHAGANAGLQFADLSFGTGYKSVSVTLKTYKTKQTGPPTVINISHESDTGMCPVQSLYEFAQVRPGNSGAIFCHANGYLVSRSQFTGVLNKCIRASPYRNSIIRSHSFRIGRATQLAAAGVPGDAIMKMGRWRSDAYLTYIR
ncbi:MAG: tyrosine-type recombinase/integrase [Sedimenticola sp.]